MKPKLWPGILSLFVVAGVLWAWHPGSDTVPAGAPAVPSAQAIQRAAAAQVRVEAPGGVGSGLRLDDSGDVLAATGVLGGAGTVNVRDALGVQHRARVRGVDPVTGLALLETSALAGGPLDFDAVETLRAGQAVYALGADTTARGQVTQAAGTLAGAADVAVIVTDARACPEDAGGALADAAGRIVGVLLPLPRCGDAIALPLAAAHRLAAQLKTGGHARRGWIGVTVADTAGGVRIESVVPDSPAAHAGLRVGDTVIACDGALPRAAGFAPRVAAMPPGHDAALTIRRDGHVLGVTVIVAAEPA